MPKELPEIGDMVFVKFHDIEECEVVGYLTDGVIEVEHQVSDGVEVTPVKEWFEEEPEDE